MTIEEAKKVAKACSIKTNKLGMADVLSILFPEFIWELNRNGVDINVDDLLQHEDPPKHQS